MKTPNKYAFHVTFCLPFTPSFITPAFRPLMIVMLQCDAGHAGSFSPQQKKKRIIDPFSFNHSWSEFFT